MPGDRVAIVGCGKEKLDVDRPVPIARLYTSGYFARKREYGKTCCDRYYILSAKHGLAIPGRYVTPYDLSIEDHDAVARAVWLASVTHSLDLAIDDGDTIVFLAGQRYFDPLADALTVLCDRAGLACPFANTSGLPEQMAWMGREIERAERAATTASSGDDQPTLDAFTDADAGGESA